MSNMRRLAAGGQESGGGGGSGLPQGVQDYTTYTEVDPSSAFSVTASAIEGSFNRAHVAYIYQDMLEVVSLDSFTITFEYFFYSGNASANTKVFAVSQVLSTAVSHDLQCSHLFTGNRRNVLYANGQTTYADNSPTRGYTKLVYDAGADTLTWYIATSSGNRDSETWAQILSLSSVGPISYQYLLAVCNSAGTGSANGWVRDLVIDGG